MKTVGKYMKTVVAHENSWSTRNSKISENNRCNETLWRVSTNDTSNIIIPICQSNFFLT